MTMQFNEETFRGDYTYRNPPAAIRRFPFPFDRDGYMYSVNIEQHPGGPRAARSNSPSTWTSITSPR